jgi:histidinol-phosphate aminotransferase
LQVVTDDNAADLVWACEPSSPLGQAHLNWPQALGNDDDLELGIGQDADIHAAKTPLLLVLDRAYAPLRLDGADSLGAARMNRVWQLFSPNKALGLTGVRAAYALAPLQAQHAAAQMDTLAPSWVVGAHGVALLMAWTQRPTQNWLQASLQTLRVWKQQQIQGLQALGWQCQPSDTPFFCARPPVGRSLPELLSVLRAQGVQLRDATSFGLPGSVRLGVLPPQAQAALFSMCASN